MRKKDESLQGKLLQHAGEIAAASGLEAITMRAVAEKAGIATGTVYNYFSSKDDILLALTEAYWRQTLDEMQSIAPGGGFCRELEEIYAFLQQRIRQSAGVLMGSLGNVEATGRKRMQSMQRELAEALLQRMEADPAVRGDIWSEAFTKEAYAHFLVMNLMLLLQTQAGGTEFLLQIVERTLY